MYKLISFIALCCFSVLAHAENYQQPPSPGPVITIINETVCNPEELPLCAESDYYEYIKDGVSINFHYDVSYNYEGWNYEFTSGQYDIEDIAIFDWSNTLGNDWLFGKRGDTRITVYMSYGEIYASKSCDYHGEGGLASVINPFLNQETVANLLIQVTLAEAELYPGSGKELVIECKLSEVNVTYF